MTNFTREDIDFDKLHAALREAHKNKEGYRMTILCCILNHAKGKLHMTKVRGHILCTMGIYIRGGSETMVSMTGDQQLKVANITRYDRYTHKSLGPYWEEFKKEPAAEEAAVMTA